MGKQDRIQGVEDVGATLRPSVVAFGQTRHALFLTSIVAALEGVEYLQRAHPVRASRVLLHSRCWSNTPMRKRGKRWIAQVVPTLDSPICRAPQFSQGRLT